MGMQVNAKSGRSKKNKDLACFHLKSRADIEIPKIDPLPKVKLPYAPSTLTEVQSLIKS